MRATRFLNACRGEPVDCTPVWLMRQAGRYLPEYRKLRSGRTFLELCRDPALAAEVTLQPIERLEVDAAILFSDILVIFDGLGIPLEFVPGQGPVISKPLRCAADISALRTFVPEEHTPYVLETIRLVRRELDGQVPLIGFAGAPLTLAAYAVEGGTSKNFTHLKRMMFAQPDVFKGLMAHLARAVSSHLRAQAEAGAQALQLFDTWAGILAPEDYARHVMPFSCAILASLRDLEVPLIHYANGAAALLTELGRLGADVLGIDWRIGLRRVVEALGPDVVLQGNLEPSVLYASEEYIESRVADVLAEGATARGHIFNLGHGVHPDIDPGRVRAMVDAVHRLSAST